jgi:hypothetical protein
MKLEQEGSLGFTDQVLRNGSSSFNDTSPQLLFPFARLVVTPYGALLSVVRERPVTRGPRINHQSYNIHIPRRALCNFSIYQKLRLRCTHIFVLLSDIREYMYI